LLTVLAISGPSAVAAPTTCVAAGSTTLTAAMVVSSSQVISGTTINAAGCDIGIYVSPGISGVTISGVTVTGAGQHGIFVQDANQITIENNLITGNGVATRVCPPSGTPPPGCIPENKAIQLVGTSNSVIMSNDVTNNSGDGGIGIADDGPQNPGAPMGVAGASLQATNDKVVGNTIDDNTHGCGVVVAGYNTGVGTNDVWVVNNTITGQAPGTPITSPNGPFIGQIVVATDGPGITVTNTWVTGNTLNGAFLPGIVVHANVFGDQILNTTIKDNVIANPGFYPGPPPGAPGYDPNIPGATDGTVGISLVAEFPPFSGPGTYPIISNTLVASDTVLNSNIGVWMCNNNDTVITNLQGNPSTPTASCQVPGITSSQILVNTTSTDGTPIAGLYTTLWQDGTMVQSCFSPCSFAVQNGQTYRVAIDNYASYVFGHWSDGTSNTTPWGGYHDLTVPSAVSTISLTAIYSKS
jgi:parallel beta-helix repeat protein